MHDMNYLCDVEMNQNQPDEIQIYSGTNEDAWFMESKPWC